MAATGASESDVMTVLPFAVLFGAPFIGIFYFWLSEAFFGATIGKWALRIRVVSRDGEWPRLGASFLRSLLRSLELSPIMIYGLVGFILVLATRLKQRLGDMAASTVVLDVSDIPPPSRGNLKAMRITLLTLAAAGVISCMGGIMTISRWVQEADRLQTFVTEDGRYQLSVPADFEESREEYDQSGLLLTSEAYDSVIYVMDGGDEWDGSYTLEQFADQMRVGVSEGYEAELEGDEMQRLDLNGNAAYRFTMHRQDEDGYWYSYTVTVTGDEEQFYCIVALFIGPDDEIDSIRSFHEQYARQIERLDRWAGTFEQVHRTISI